MMVEKMDNEKAELKAAPVVDPMVKLMRNEMAGKMVVNEAGKKKATTAE